MIENPVLPGFNPDPSIVRVGNDYYIATSTMVWQPGIRLFHSTDLANWKDKYGLPVAVAAAANNVMVSFTAEVWLIIGCFLGKGVRRRPSKEVRAA